MLNEYFKFDTLNGKIIELSLANKILFGNNDPFCMVNKMVLFTTNIICYKDHQYFLKKSQFDNYIKTIKSNINFSKKCFPYNFLKFINQKVEYDSDEEISKVDNDSDDEISDFIGTNTEPINKHIQEFDYIKCLFEYGLYLKSKEDFYASNIYNIIFNKNGMFNGEVYDGFDDMICLVINKPGKPLFINFVENTNSVKYKLSKIYSNQINDDFDKLFEEHKQILLMDDPKIFLINNLFRVTGDYDFSVMAVESYILRDTFTTPILGLCELLSFGWKDDKSKDDYVDFFVSKYPHLIKTKITDQLHELYTNFEGFNKFLLNIEEKYINRWDVKEQINELYYSITFELIHSFEILYNNK